MNNSYVERFICASSGSQAIRLSRALSVVALVVLLNTSFSQKSEAIQDNSVVNDDENLGCKYHLPFDGSVSEATGNLDVAVTGKPEFFAGLANQAIRFQKANKPSLLSLPIDQKAFDNHHDFSVHFWVRTTMPSDQKGVLISTKSMDNYGLKSQKKQGWAFLCSNGTWGWNMGSGNRRITYERSNGEYFRINDGRWHQLAMTHESSKSLIRLYLDGRNLVTYNVKDSGSFDFGSSNAITVGWTGEPETGPAWELPIFVKGANQLQEMVDEFNRIGLPKLEPGEFEMLVSRPSRLVSARIERLAQKGNEESATLIKNAKQFDLKKIEGISKRLMSSAYTVHQSSYYNEVALVFRLYRLENGKISIDRQVAKQLAQREVLNGPEFDMDELMLWNRVLSPEEISASYSRYFQALAVSQSKNLKSLVAGAWNIFHGGLHQSIERDGFDSREVIIDLLKREQIDVLMMQETYSSGDYVAAELGYYFATTIDWDNMSQGANISVLSRYPIKDVFVPPKSTFMSVGTKVSLSQSQDIYVMSSWFGMRNFEDVFDFHQKKFDESDSIPTLLAGDFNAIPHTDGGNSPASEKLLDYGFTDAYRSLYPDVEEFPGYTHRSDRRIDQVYFKGKGLKILSTEVHSEWPSKFPPDHYLMRSEFELDYSTRRDGK